MSNNIYPLSGWDIKAYNALNDFYLNYDSYKNGSKKLMTKNREKYTIKNMSDLFYNIIEKHYESISEEVVLNLPKLNLYVSKESFW